MKVPSKPDLKTVMPVWEVVTRTRVPNVPTTDLCHKPLRSRFERIELRYCRILLLHNNHPLPLDAWLWISVLVW